VDDAALERWLDAVHHQFDNRAVDVIYHAHCAVDALCRSKQDTGDKNPTAGMEVFYEDTGDGGIRLFDSCRYVAIELASRDECAEFVAKLHAKHCRDRFETMTDWFLFCTGRT
jgi:hypothetical protein